jgi:hypothetical protein
MILEITSSEQGYLRYPLSVVAAFVPSAEFEDQALGTSASTTDAQRQVRIQQGTRENEK